MKRFVYGTTNKTMVTPEDKVTSYTNGIQASHASYTLNR